MVLSRIILTALLALGSITVALPVIPGDVAGTTPTPGSGAPLPHLQGSLAVGDGVPLQDGMKGVSPPVGGPSSPHGNEAGRSISPRQESSAVPPPERRGNYISSFQRLLEEYKNQAYIKQECRKQEDDKEEIRRDIALVKNFPNLHEHYKEIADRLSAHLDEPPSFNIKPSLSVQRDCYSMGLLRAITDLFSEPYDGRDPTIEKLRKAFEEGESPENLRAILRDSPELGIH